MSFGSNPSIHEPTGRCPETGMREAPDWFLSSWSGTRKLLFFVAFFTLETRLAAEVLSPILRTLALTRWQSCTELTSN
jgi:hypothetical protein